MAHSIKLLPFIKPYWKWSILSLFLLIAVVLMELALPRLIDQGINKMMFSISVFQVLFALGNNYFHPSR